MDPPIRIVGDDAKIIHLRQMRLLETGVYSFPLLGSESYYRCFAFTCRDVFGEIA